MAYDPNEVQSYIREAATRRGIDPSTALRVFKQESSFNPLAKNISDREESYGVTQLNAKGGLGVDALKSGIDIRNPDTWKQQVDFSLDTVAKDGWRQWYGARDVGINRWDGIGGRSGGGAAGAVTQMAGGGRADADSPLVSAYADRGATGTKVAGPSTQAAGQVVNVAPEQSTDLEKAMLGRALQTQVRNPWDAIGGLAQVWAANSAMKEKQAANADSLKQAVAGAGLDPDMAMAAQLGGTRESLADALVTQRQARTQAEQRQQEQNWRQEGREYQQGRDRVADERYAAERTHLTDREAVADARADRKEEPYRTLTPEEVEKAGLPPGQSYQVGPNGKVDAIAGPKQPGGGITIGADGSVQIGGAPKMPSNFMADPANPGAVKPIPGGPGEQIPGELAARVGLADSFLEQLPALREKVVGGAVTGLADRWAAGNNQSSDQAGIYRQLESGTDALMRLLTGAGMNNTEAEAYARRYLPTYTDDGPSAASKLDQLGRELQKTKDMAMRGRGGPPGGAPPQSPEAPPTPSPTPQRARNPQTGQIVELRNGQWVPVQ